MPEPTFTDDEGAVWTASQIRAATEQQVKDESGQGSLGGLATDQENALTPTAAPAAPDPVDQMVAQVGAGEKHRGRELDPIHHFGQFFKDNIAAPTLDAGYVTGKRPMNALDYATDVLSAYGGEDLGKRNAQLRKGANAGTLDQLKAAHIGSQIKKEQADTSKSGMESSKLLDDAISNTFENYDSDLWSGRVTELAKQHGVEIPKTSVQMIERAMQKMHEVGATSVLDVIHAPPGKYPPEVVNRVKHLNALVGKHAEESAGREALTEQRKQAGALSATRTADVGPAASDRAARVGQGATNTALHATSVAASPNVQASQASGIVPRALPGGGAGPGPTDQQLSDAAANRVAMKGDTSTTRTMQEAAPKVLSIVDTVEANLKKVKTGPIASRYQEAWTGKVGAKNPDFMRLRTNADLLSTMLSRMHVGARGTESIMARFDKMIGAGYQSPENMQAALDEIRAYAQDVAAGAGPPKIGTAGGLPGGHAVGDTLTHASGATITRVK